MMTPDETQEPQRLTAAHRDKRCLVTMNGVLDEAKVVEFTRDERYVNLGLHGWFPTNAVVLLEVLSCLLLLCCLLTQSEPDLRDAHHCDHACKPDVNAGESIERGGCRSAAVRCCLNGCSEFVQPLKALLNACAAVPFVGFEEQGAFFDEGLLWVGVHAADFTTPATQPQPEGLAA